MSEQTYYRLVKTRYASTAFDGYGARTYGGRWNSPGKNCVYLGSSRALCVLETLVHLEIEDLMQGYTLLSIQVPKALVVSLDREALPKDWQSEPAPRSTQRIGDEWLEGDGGLLLQVPSTITGEWNALFNPAHSRAKAVLDSQTAEALIIDPRLGLRR